MYRPNEIVAEVLTRYEDESEAIEDIVIESEISMSIIEPLFESVLAADVKPIMIPTPKRRLRQSDSKEDQEDPESSDQEVVRQRTHRESSIKKKSKEQRAKVREYQRYR